MTSSLATIDQWFAQTDVSDLTAEVAATYGVFLSQLNRVPPAKHARDVLNPRKVAEKLAVLTPFTGDLAGRTLLEIGSGYGMFIAVTRQVFGIHSFGLEPGGAGYELLQISRRLMARYGLPPKIIVEGFGEQMPFAADTFDVVFSTHVLEHVQSPAAVLRETARVLRPGGVAQMIVPNYGSFWDGHYGMFWPPYISSRVARLIVRLAGRNPAFVDTLQLITLRQLRAIMRPLAPAVQVLDWGDGLFHDRLTRGQFSNWAALSRVKRLVDAVRRLGIADALSFVLRHADAITPIVLTFKKRG